MMQFQAWAQLSCALLVTVCLLPFGYAKCEFKEPHKKRTYTHHPVDVEFKYGDVMNRTNVYFISLLGGTSDEVILTCSNNETIVISGSELNVQGDYLSTNLPRVFIKANLNNGTAYPDSNGGDLVITLPSDGNVTPLTLFQGGNNAGSSTYLSIEKHINLSEVVTTGIVHPFKLFNVSTSDGLDVLDVFVDSFTISRKACGVTNYTNSISFGAVFDYKLNSPGSTGDTEQFNISIVCNNAAVDITFEGEMDANYPVFVNSSKDNNARGVGVQLLKGSEIIIPGEAMFISNMLHGEHNLEMEFNARLFSLHEKTTGGAVDIPVTFTINYQ